MLTEPEINFKNLCILCRNGAELNAQISNLYRRASNIIMLGLISIRSYKCDREIAHHNRFWLAANVLVKLLDISLTKATSGLWK